MIASIIKKDVAQLKPWAIGVTVLAVIYCTVNLLRWPAPVNWYSSLFPFVRDRVSEIDVRPPLMRLTSLYFLASGYGMLLGFLQGLSETHTTADFFFHRPCSRSRLAIAKLTAGTLLYWIPGILTIGLVTLHACFGRFACPFRLWMTAVPLLAWWIGYSFYLAALNAVWQSGKWYGSRLLPLAIMFVVASFVWYQPTLGVPIGIAALTTVSFWIINIHSLVHWEG